MSEAIITADENVRHANHNHQHGFDLTEFDSPTEFKIVLDAAGLTPEDYHGVVETIFGPKGYVWANEDGMILTANNPISGEYASDTRDQVEEGYASYIGIEGSEEFVETVREAVREHATYIKGESVDSREFI